MTDRAYQWTVRLAQVLSGAVRPDFRRAAVKELAASHATGDDAIDQNRLRILDLIALRDSRMWPVPTSAVSDPTLPPATTQGIAMVAVDLGPQPLSTDVIRNWLSGPVDDLVLIDARWNAPPSIPPLSNRLRMAGIADPRLMLIRLDGPVTWTQAFNIGLRSARRDRIWVVDSDARLTASPPPPATLPKGSFAASPAGVSAFLLDLHRVDVAAVGGFNEYIETSDGAVADLVQRLNAQGSQERALQPGLLTDGAPAQAPAALPDSATLRDALLQSPDFAAYKNRAIAAAMPTWAGPDQQIPFEMRDLDALGQHVQPLTPRTEPVTEVVRAEASLQALTHLLRDRFNGQSVPISQTGLDLVLSRPAADVGPVDLAVAASMLPAVVVYRAGWLVLHMDATCLPLRGSPAAKAFATLRTMADSHRQTPVLCVADAETAAILSGLTDCPVVVGPLDTGSIWPTELRELGRPLGRAPRHATLPFNRQTVADLQQLGPGNPGLLNRRPKIFIDAQHGLGNRMRAIASAGAIAAGTDRELVIIWTPDDHCACSFDDLFFPHGAVLTQGFAAEAQSMGLALFNYMEVEPGAAKDAPIAMGAFQDVYIRSAFPLISPCSNWHTENAAIHQMQPNEVVRALVSSVRNPNDVSLHIRMEGGTAFEHLPYESPANWTAEAHQTIHESRQRSHFSYFLPRLDQLIAQGLADTVFLATDTPAVYGEFQSRYGARVTSLPRNVSDRSAQAIVYALADAILLGRAPRLLGSTWSSFSELAARLSAAPMTVELTGRDF